MHSAAAIFPWKPEAAHNMLRPRFRGAANAPPARVRPLRRKAWEAMVRAISLGVVLYAVWWLLSGHLDPLLLGLGAACSLLVVVIAWRMDVIDHEGHPVQLTWRILLYWPWLVWEIAKANLEVARIIVDPKLPISPEVIRVRASQKSELGQVIYANSITLTPGTVSVDVADNAIDVHCLTRELAAGLQQGEMDRRVARVEERR
jgi:multicomponent Na+:H+ antiporter subunit E